MTDKSDYPPFGLGRLAVAIALALLIGPALAQAGKNGSEPKNAILVDTVSALIPSSTFFTNPVLNGHYLLGIEYQLSLGSSFALDVSALAAMMEVPERNLTRFFYGPGLGLRWMFQDRRLSGPYARLGIIGLFPDPITLAPELSFGWEFKLPMGFVIDNRINISYTLGAYIPLIGLDLLMVGIAF
jgi:hypothetical protein